MEVAVGVLDELTTAPQVFVAMAAEPPSYALVRLNVRKIAF
jgi:hypothetical protein